MAASPGIVTSGSGPPNAVVQVQPGMQVQPVVLVDQDGNFVAPGASGVLTTLGDMLYENAAPALARLPGNTASQRLFLSQAGTGTVSAAPAWSAVPGQFLASPVQYAPGTVTTYSLGQSGFAALDTANLAITFTAPASGSVLVGLQGFVVDGSAGASVWFGLLNASGGAVTGPTAEVMNPGLASKDIIVSSQHLIGGLSAGTVYTLQWAGCASAAGASVNAANTGGSTSGNPAIANAAPATMTVQAA